MFKENFSILVYILKSHCTSNIFRPYKRRFLDNQCVHAARYMRNEAHKAHKAAIHENTPAAWQKYRWIRNRTTSMLRSCKAKYMAVLSKDLKSNPSEFWKCFSHISDSGKSSTNVSAVHSAEDFNQFYLSIASDLSCKLPTSRTDPVDHIKLGLDEVPSFTFRAIEEEEVYHLIATLD